VRFSFGYAIDERVRAAILVLPERAWRPAINADGQPREGAWVAELTGHVSLDAWPEGSRLIVRRERPHPGAQLSFTDVDGHRSQCLISDQEGDDLAALEARHRAHAIVEDRVRELKSTGLSNLPFSAFQANQAWLEAALCAHDLTVWTQLLLFDGEHAVCEPKRCSLSVPILSVKPVTGWRVDAHGRGGAMRCGRAGASRTCGRGDA
jgi:hypothetical protein